MGRKDTMYGQNLKSPLASTLRSNKN